jgi:ribosome-associated heat shock protein Hsp15
MTLAPAADDEARLDKWLWAARFFKTRSLAAEAIEGGKVEVNDEKPKRAKSIRPGDRIRIRQGPYEYRITVTAIARQRGSAAVAAGLYEESSESRTARERLAEQHRLAARMYGEEPAARPTKKARRDLERWKRDD